MPTFTENVRDAWLKMRRTQGIAQNVASTMIGVHQNTLSRWELAKAKLPEPAFNKVVALLAQHGFAPDTESPSLNIVWVECPECASKVPALIGTQKLTHCGACGQALGKLCPNTDCHHLNRFQARFCEACGATLHHNTNYQLLRALPPRAAEDNGQAPAP